MANQNHEGEGNRTAAKEYNQDQQRFVESGKVKPAAQDAQRAVEGAEGDELRKAEEIGKRHSHGEDPAISKG